MKRMHYLIITILLLSSTYSFAQYCAPLQLGNVWVYKSYVNGLTEKYTVIDTNYIFNKKSYCRMAETVYLLRFNYTDSLFYEYWSKNLEIPYYKYNCSVGDTFSYYLGPNTKITYAVIDTFLAYVFDTILTVKIIHQNAGGLNEYYQGWTDELGLLRVMMPGQVISELKGCVINGRVYGDTSVTSDIKEDNIQPFNYNLSQNYPNPFNSTTKIEYEIKNYSLVTLEVFDLLGNKVTTLVNENKRPGKYSAIFSESNLVSGVYLYKLNIGGNTKVRKMVLLR